MRKKSTFRSAFSSPRVLICFAFLIGLLLALIAGYRGATALAGPPPSCVPAGSGLIIFGFRADNHLISYLSSAPGTLRTDVAIVGVAAGETLVGIDFRPQNGLLYGLGVNATTNTATLYAISSRTGVAGAVGTPGQVAFTADGFIAIDLPDPATTGYGFDFNPAVDRVRVTTSSGLNFRINPNTGAPVDGDNTGLTVGIVTGTNPDGPINGSGSTGVSGAAYTNNQPNNGNITTLYTLDDANEMLFIQNNANVGTQTMGQTVTLGGSPLNFTTLNGFDIPAGVNAPASNSPVTTGSGFAALNVAGNMRLYSINLVNAQATFLGNIGNGTSPVYGLSVQNDLGGIPAIAMTSDGANLVRFNTSTPGTTVTQVITTAGLAAGEQLVGIDWRPLTGQLYGLGVNATANTASLYIVDPQTGGLTAVGSPGAISFTTNGSTAVDFPDPNTTGYGLDFNPVADRIRVTTSTGLNFRIVPSAGVPVDGDNTGLTSGAVTGTNPDGSINGSGSTGVSGNAYTNNFGQGAGGPTTLYTLDASSNVLFIQSSPNVGTQTMPLPVTLSGGPLDFTNANGFDIPAKVSVGSNDSAATGLAYAALTVGVTTRLFQIELSTGEATDLGLLGSGANMAGLTLGDSPDICPAGPAPTPTPTPTATPTPTPIPLTTQAINLSTRMRVGTGDHVGIGGFIITGSAPKHVLLRAIGPSLTRFGITNVLPDPVLELHGPGAFVTVTNNDWRDTQETEIQATNIPPTNDFESAIEATLDPGAYTAIVTGNGASNAGVALIEVYDLDQAAASKLANLSTRAFIGTGSDIVIAGFLLSDNTVEDRIVVRGLGPSIAGSFPPGAILANPILELRNSDGALLFTNNDWQDNPAQAAELTAEGLAPTNSLEAAMSVSLPPGLYTALLAGLNNGTGIGLVEVYDLGP